MKTYLSSRPLSLLLWLISLSVLIASLYFQYVGGLQPCPLCIMQRICVILLVVGGALLCYVSKIRCFRGILFGQLFVAGAGLFFASRQLWLQSLPADQAPTCLPGLDVLIKYFPWQDVLHAILWGSGDCAEVDWQWLGLSMAAWAGLYFLLMIFAFIYQLVRERR